MPSCFQPDGDSRRGARSVSTDRRVVLAVGRLVPIKNMALLVDAMRAVRERDPRCAPAARRRRTRARRALRARAAASGCRVERDVRRLRAARRPAGVLPDRRCVRAHVRLRQLAERRARSDGLRAAGGRHRCRRRDGYSSPSAAATLVPLRRCARAGRRDRALARIDADRRTDGGRVQPAARARAILLARERAAAARASTNACCDGAAPAGAPTA